MDRIARHVGTAKAGIGGTLRSLALAAVTLLAVPADQVSAQELVAPKRLAITRDMDLPGGDIASMLDTTIEACQRACLANDSCTALTFNSRAGACFLKNGAGAPAPYQGAISARVLNAEPGLAGAAAGRSAALAFLRPSDLDAARDLARGLAMLHVTGEVPAGDHLAAARREEINGYALRAAERVGAALNLTDSAGDWAEYARLALKGSASNQDMRREWAQRAVSAAINALLRSDNPGLRHGALVTMAQALESIGRGRDMVPALQLAQAEQPRDDTAGLLDDAIEKFGFRITEHQVQSDLAQPRLCAVFSEELAESGVEFGDFVQTDIAGISVEKSGSRQLCVDGLSHGQRVSVTFRAGIPSAEGQMTARPVAVNAYIRDRNPAVRFAGRAYVLPRMAEVSIPVETVNTTELDLTLYRVTDRNILRSVQGRFLSEPMPYYREDDFGGEVGTEIWTGSATVTQEVNRDITTRLPLAEALAGQGAGIYALRAALPGKEPYDFAPAWQWFVSSDLGMISFSGVEGLHVVIRSLGTAGPKPGVTVELLSRANEVLGVTETDAEGMAHFPAALTRGRAGAAPAMLVAREGEDDLAFLSLTDPEFDLSDRGVEGREPAPPVDVFVTTERGAYRAGETVHVTALARDPQSQAVEGLPLTAIVKRPDGVEYSRSTAQDSAMGGHVFALPIAGSAPRGLWRLEILADLEAPPLAAKTFLVEDFLPERIDFDLTLADTPLRPGDVAEADLAVRYLFGAPGADLAIEGETLLRATRALDGFPGFVFGRHDEPFNTLVRSFDGMRTDAEGRATLPLALAPVENADRPLEMVAAVRVSEGSGRPVERRVTRALTPDAPVIGLRPLFDDVVPEGGAAEFEIVAVGPEGRAVPMPVVWEVTRIETRYQWYQEYGDWYWEPVTTRSRVANGVTELGAEPARIAAPVTWGQYELAVTQASGGAAASSVGFDAGWYAPADVASSPDRLELSLDKPGYRAGEVARLRIVPRAAGTALISVLSNRLVSMQAVAVTEGENIISLPVTDDWGAGVYVTASVLRPMDVAAGRNPARAMGLAHAAIDPGDRALDVTVEAPAEVAPRGPLDLAVRVAGVQPGDTAHVTVAAVDVGILNLTGFEAPDPKGHYFGQRKLGVGIRDLYGRLIDAMAGMPGQVRSGGDGGAQARLQSPPPTEELVAYFSGPVQIGPDGLARVSFDLPSFNGTVRVMAVAWSQRGVGQAEADVLVRDPVVVTASVPRFLSPGDESRMLLEIVHATGPAGRMGLDVTASGLALGPVPSGFDLAEQGKARFEIPLVAGAEGVQSIDITLTTPEGRQLTKRLSLPVQAGDPEVARMTRLELQPGQTFTLDQSVFAGFHAGSGLATMAVGPIARLDTPGLLAALDRYPYGCTEQITSRALPLIYFDQVAQAMRLKGAEDIRDRIEQAVAEVLTNQSSDGGFGLWSANSGDFWLDAYVTDFLSRARANGHTVPDIAFRAALDNLRTQVNYTADFDRGGEALAYALMVLAREGAAAIGDLRYYADVKADAFATPVALAQLGAALASYGDQARADAMFRKAGGWVSSLPLEETEQLFRADYGTNRRDTAAVLTLALESGSEALDREAFAARLTRPANRLSTQEATWTLLAANALIDRPGTEGITLNGQPVDGPLVRVLEAGNPDPVAVVNGSDRAAVLTVTAYGVPEVPEAAGGNGYAIRRSYYDMEGNPADASAVAAGTRLVAVLEVEPFSMGEARLMVTDPLPAGFEIDNPNLIRAGQISALDWLEVAEAEHAEFRQDRFLAAVDQRDESTIRLAYVIRAVSPGAYHHPAASVEDMYRPDFRAQTDAGRVIVTP
ncbi:alpha-2-macroglobulin family protein [Szabonella alba]|uniref:Alpha-2-macroglobulin family protein n=1 Tax=Szabonella alba TaxID=2804194 RepID=A0A8K0V5U9_9RHOB|nr:alpha-2-macroglobulin family protein [Szabonella alba]MBL4915731.1 alpha-2-macroglobulin family protein [Szabonella alba]